MVASFGSPRPCQIQSGGGPHALRDAGAKLGPLLRTRSVLECASPPGAFPSRTGQFTNCKSAPGSRAKR